MADDDRDRPAELVDSMLDVFDQLVHAQDRHPVIRRGEREPISDGTRLAVKMRDGFACVWCFSKHELQLDHIIPWSAGGSDETTNLRTLCASCNEHRSNRRYAGDTGPALPIAWQCTRCNPPAESEWSGLRPAFCVMCRSRGRAFEQDCR
jgi:hypothetical protein